ncbi:MAG TPA: thymidine phosphorylase [Elusimicrobia bacterium]|nr:thymidine phosphorylase [Elusimicrobiota bacterium]HBT60200.1 thymidine phosphorylase [Elusimicrobiota bacterium]
MRMLDLIAKKRLGGALARDEIRFIVKAAATAGPDVPDYQLAAWLMAVCCRGMNEAETVCLAREMAQSGARLDLSGLKAPKVDKHSTGGVGDGVSLALAPLMASAGLIVPMMSGRGLGHTGGTLDKLEAMAGFKVRLGIDAIARQLADIGVCMFGQTQDLAPADRKLYSLRDATSTVESVPLVVASILSKKFAEDLDALVLDVKVGAGAIFKNPKEARILSQALVKTGQKLGLKSVAVLTAMDQPLGRYVGNALEVRQAVEILRGDFTSADYAQCLLTLGAWMLHLTGKAETPKAGMAKLQGLIRSGAALESFKKMVEAQGADPRVADDLSLLPKAGMTRDIAAPKAGYVAWLDARKVGEAAVILGAGRAHMEQSIDYGAGFVLEKKVGDRVGKGETLALIHGSDAAKMEQATACFMTALKIDARKPKPMPVIRQVIRPS